MYFFVSEDHMQDWHSCQTCYPLEKKCFYLYYVRLKPACAATEKLVRDLETRDII